MRFCRLQMACESFGYDCDITVDTAAAVGTLKNFHAYTIGMCTRVKNEGSYLGEWIDFHRLAGVRVASSSYMHAWLQLMPSMRFHITLSHRDTVFCVAPYCA